MSLIEMNFHSGVDDVAIVAQAPGAPEKHERPHIRMVTKNNKFAANGHPTDKEIEAMADVFNEYLVASGRREKNTNMVCSNPDCEVQWLIPKGHSYPDPNRCPCCGSLSTTAKETKSAKQKKEMDERLSNPPYKTSG